MSFSCGSDTDAIALDLDIAGKLSASLLLSPDSGNAAEIRANGLFVPGGVSVTSLPGGPSDGDIAYYLASDGAGIVWPFKYRAASGSLYKWEAIGASALYEVVDVEDTFGGGVPAGYVNIPGGTVGPSVVVPLEGDYDVRLDAMIDGAAAGTNTAASLKIGATPAADVNSIANFDTRLESLSRTVRLTAVPAGTQILMQYVKANAADAHFAHRALTIVPVRVTG